MDQDDTATAGISRRSVLKRAAVGGAVVWAAPAITSLSSPAYAQGSPSCTEETCSKVVIGPVTIFFRCTPAPTFEGCLCKCGGDPNSPCVAPNPCVVPLICIEDPTCTF